MLKYQQILDEKEPLFNNIYKLYVTAFPANERRTKKEFVRTLEKEKKFNVYALIRDEKFVGFITLWFFEKFIYVEHFAIDTHLQGQNIGSDTIRILLKESSLPVVLEVEMPSNMQAVKRINFYERFGFYILSQAYAQPPYNINEQLLPMIIMSNDYHFADKHFRMIKETLHKEVYHYTSPSEYQLPG